jgi:hypothetical protein
MKLSNKILIGFFGLIFLYLTAAFAELRMTGTPGVIDDKNSMAETVDITGVTYLILNDIDKQINVVGADEARLEVRSISGHLLTKLNYKVSGDTLTLSGVDSGEINTMKITVFIPRERLRGITVNRAMAILRGMESELLSLSQNSGTILMSESTVRNIEIHLDQSYLDISDTNLDTVSVNLERSEVNMNARVRLVRGELNNRALLRLSDVEEIQLKKDVSSRLQTFQ